VAEAEVETAGVLVGALADELAVEPVLAGKRDLFAGPDRRDRLEPGVPAVVEAVGLDPQSSSPTLRAVSLAA
jgi:hypothetical protein